jgi:carbon-monoxide dehydrogenase medium subunit
MKAPAFAYARARSLPEALQLLSDHGDGAKVLAGGQSLIPALNMRLSAPALLVDITRIAELSGIRHAGGKLHIGALTTHAEIGRSPEIARLAPLLAQAVPHIAHPAIRNVGTLGGSLVTADPAAEWPACCLALDAEFILTGKAGERRVKARDFFTSVYTTDLRAHEILTGIELPAAGAAQRSVFLELARRRGDFAIVGVAAVAAGASGALTDVRLAYLGAGEKPLLARGAMAAVEGKKPSGETGAAAAAALAGDLAPLDDIHTGAAAKLHLARVLTARALAALAN